MGLTAACVAVAAAISVRFVLFLPPNVYDEGIRATGSFLVAEGRLPYRDFYCIYGFADFYLGAAALKAFGHSLATVRAMQVAWHALFVAAGALLSMRLGGRIRDGLLTAAILIPMLESSATSATICVAAGLIVAVSAWPARRRARWIACGACFGVAAWFRPDTAVYGMLGTALSLAVAWRGGARAAQPDDAAVRPSARCMLTGLFATAVIALAGYAPFLIASHADVWRGLVEIPIQSLPGRRLPFPSPADQCASPYYLHVIALVAAAARLFMTARNRAWTAERCGMLGAVAIGMLHWPYAFGRCDLVHQIPSVFFAAVALPSVAWGARRGAAARRPAGVIRAVVCLCYAGAAIRLPAGGIRTQQSLGAPPAGQRVKHGGSAWIDADLRSTLDLLESRFPAGAPLFSGVPHHDKVVGNDVMLYFLSGRPPAVRDHHFDPCVTTSAPTQARMISDLEQNRPPAVVLWKPGSMSREPNLSSRHSGVTLLDEYIAARYAPIAEFGAYFVLARQPVAPQWRVSH
jgi:hypothetical protein